MSFSFKPISTSLLLMLNLSSSTWAITVFDVIQLNDKAYSDEDIIALIKATNSAFTLKAADVKRLIELGVNEPVIQVMLKTTPPAKTLTASPASNAQHPKHSKDKAKHDTVTTSSTTKKQAGIGTSALKEHGSGNHHHQVITFSGIQLFILRDEGRYSSLKKRAQAVALRLKGVSLIDGQFQPRHVAGRNEVAFIANKSTQAVTIISVSAGDARAYQKRSGRKVTPNLLATYWSRLLTDYWTLIFTDRAPQQLTKLHKGEALQSLYNNLDRAIEDNTNRLTRAFQSLPEQEQEHLLQLSISVPKDFNAPDEHTGDTP